MFVWFNPPLSLIPDFTGYGGQARTFTPEPAEGSPRTVYFKFRSPCDARRSLERRLGACRRVRTEFLKFIIIQYFPDQLLHQKYQLPHLLN